MTVLAVSDLALALITAGAAILGAIAGGAVTGFVSLRAEDKRQAFARQMEDRRAAQERDRQYRAEQASGRLILEELVRCSGALSASVGKTGGLPDAELVLPMDAWEAESKALAGTAPFELWWEHLMAAYNEVDGVRKQYRSTGLWPGAERLRAAHQAVEDAAELLTAYMASQHTLAGHEPDKLIPMLREKIEAMKAQGTWPYDAGTPAT